MADFPYFLGERGKSIFFEGMYSVAVEIITQGLFAL